jgi:D-alanine-D-alanine ligase
LKIVNGKLKIAVLAGGIGEERDISLQSGGCVAQALREAGLNVVLSDIRPDNLDILEDTSIDIFFPVLHGRFGEDGRLQQILEDKSFCYTGSGPKASGLAFDKMAAKKAFAQSGLRVPTAVQFDADTDIGRLEEYLGRFADKYVVKPVNQGSSVGVTIVTERRRVIPAAKKTLEEFGDCMIEEFISGREMTVGILCDKPLPVIEIKPKEDFYNYRAKYLDDQTQFLFGSIDEPAVTAALQSAAMDCFRALGCRDFARVDFILSDDCTPYALEVNTIPGFTTHSLLPKAAAAAGFSMGRLCVKIVTAAMEDRNIRCAG